jgi:hypothetical protein
MTGMVLAGSMGLLFNFLPKSLALIQPLIARPGVRNSNSRAKAVYQTQTNQVLAQSVFSVQPGDNFTISIR